MNYLLLIFIALLFVMCAPENSKRFSPRPTPTPWIVDNATPIPEPTRSACEFEVESLKGEVNSLRDLLRETADVSCECYYARK